MSTTRIERLAALGLLLLLVLHARVARPHPRLVLTVASGSEHGLATFDGTRLLRLWPESQFDSALFMASDGRVIFRVIRAGRDFPQRKSGWMLWNPRSERVKPLMSGPFADERSSFLRGRYYGEATPFWRDNSFFLYEHQKFDLIVRRAFVGNVPRRFLQLVGLYAFVTRADRCTSYVIWGRTGTESREFVDLIPGKPMSLWWVCGKTKPRRLTEGSSIQKLQFVEGSRALIYLEPKRRGRQKFWTLWRLDPKRGKKRAITDIPAPRQSRSTPTLLAWPDLPWVVYPAHETAFNQPVRYRRHNLATGRIVDFVTADASTTLMRGSPAGFVVLYNHRERRVSVYSAVTGRRVLGGQLPVRPNRMLYLPGTGSSPKTNPSSTMNQTSKATVAACSTPRCATADRPISSVRSGDAAHDGVYPHSRERILAHDHPNGRLLMGKGSRLFRFRRGIDRSWQLVADLGGWKIRQIGRLAIDPQQHGLALVGR